ncbi:hypothetical protein BH11PSE8_BH11PSE8_12080 [soil metagenome]
MNDLLQRIGIRLLLCVAASWIVWRVGGLAVMIVTAPLYGVALARPLIDLMSGLRHAADVAVWQSVEGRHFAFRGTPVQVLEDADHVRWIRAADVRRIVGYTASHGAIALTYPNGWRLMGQPPEPHFGEDALITHLSKETSQGALRFRHWAEREIVFPARRQRERLGIRLPAADTRPGAAE